VHETQNGVYVSFVDTAPTKFIMLYVIHTVDTATERPLTLELDLQEGRKLAVLETPQILAIFALTRSESPPELSLDEGSETANLAPWWWFDVKVRVESCTERD
jgi:hypothetical protein